MNQLPDESAAPSSPSPEVPERGPLRTYTVVRETWLTKKPKPESATVAILATGILALATMLEWAGFFHTDTLFPASYAEVFTHHEIWRAWTTMLVHSDIAHLASNSLLFFFLSYFLYGYFGISLFPIGVFVFGGFANLAVLPTYEPETVLIGASGAVYVMGGAWLILYFFLSRQKNLWQRYLRSFGVGLALFMPSQAFDPAISNRTHLTGFVLGVVLGLGYYLLHRTSFLASEVREVIVEEEDDLHD